jgi:hypothetical protein
MAEMIEAKQDRIAELEREQLHVLKKLHSDDPRYREISGGNRKSKASSDQ